MKIDRKKLDLALARREMSLVDIAETIGVSPITIQLQVTKESILPKTAGRIAKALNVDVTEIIED